METTDPTAQPLQCEGPQPNVDDCQGPPSSEAAAEGVAHQFAGRDLSRNPPRFAGMRLYPIPGGARGLARLEADIAEDLPSVVKFIWNDRVNALRDDGTNGDRRPHDHVYTAYVDVAFARDMGMLGDDALAALERGQTDGTLAAQGVVLMGQDTALGANQSDVSLVTSAVTINDPDVCVGASCVPDVEKAFVVRNTRVVNSNRTSDPCKSPTDTARRAWNFGYLISKLAGSSATPTTMSNFTKNWLSAWVGPQIVNDYMSVRAPATADGHTLAGDLLTDWINAGPPSGLARGTLAMSKAPFRLLAIVNRFDLRTNFFTGANSGGELRFVFTPLSFLAPRESDGSCGVMGNPGLPELTNQDLHTVILEYGVKFNDQASVRNWAIRWRELGKTDWSNPPGSTNPPLNKYLTDLEGITESIVSKGPSALNRIRTNEALNSSGPWHLREFTIQNGTLRSTTVKQTPEFSFNGTKILGQWITSNKDAINRLSFIEGTGQVPAKFPDASISFLGGQAVNVTRSGSDFSAPGATKVWRPQDPALDYSNRTDIDARHNFALGTCNGCHGFETMDPNLSATPEFFAHIMPRKRVNASMLSNFLTGVPMGQPLNSTTKVDVPDPEVPSVRRHFNQIAKRNQRMADLIDGRTTATLAFQPSPMAD